MARIKEATNKKVVTDKTGEPKITKKRGRQPGQVIKKEPAVIVELNKDYRIRMDKLSYTLQVKMEKSENPEIDEIENETTDVEDVGWKVLGYFSPSIVGLGHLFENLRSSLLLKKCKKEQKKENQANVVSAEKFMELIVKSTNEAKKMFGVLEVDVVKKKVKIND